MTMISKVTRKGRPSDAVVAIRHKKVVAALLAGCELKAAAAEADVSWTTAGRAARRVFKMERRWLLPDEWATVQANRSKSAQAA